MLLRDFFFVLYVSSLLLIFALLVFSCLFILQHNCGYKRNERVKKRRQTHTHTHEKFSMPARYGNERLLFRDCNGLLIRPSNIWQRQMQKFWGQRAGKQRKHQVVQFYLAIAFAILNIELMTIFPYTIFSYAILYRHCCCCCFYGYLCLESCIVYGMCRHGFAHFHMQSHFGKGFRSMKTKHKVKANASSWDVWPKNVPL